MFTLIYFQSTLFNKAHTIDGRNQGARFGTAVVELGDLDKDGCAGELNIHTYTHIHSINPVSASDLQLDVEHVNKLDNTEHI